MTAESGSALSPASLRLPPRMSFYPVQRLDFLFERAISPADWDGAYTSRRYVFPHRTSCGKEHTASAYYIPVGLSSGKNVRPLSSVMPHSAERWLERACGITLEVANKPDGTVVHTLVCHVGAQPTCPWILFYRFRAPPAL